MLGFYIKSTIIYLIITFCFIPIIRIIIIGVILFISFGSKESLDKLMKKNLEDK